jgi:hypothetical protein
MSDPDSPSNRLRQRHPNTIVGRNGEPGHFPISCGNGWMPIIERCFDQLDVYGPVVNINPALFNFVVAAYERLRNRGASLAGEAVEEFAASYGYEEENNLPHVVDGRLATSAGSIDELLTDIVEPTPSSGAAGNF